MSDRELLAIVLALLAKFVDGTARSEDRAKAYMLLLQNKGY